MFSYDEKKFFTPHHEHDDFPSMMRRESLPQKVEHTSRLLRDSLDRLQMFERTMKEKYDDLFSIMTQDNVTFKELMQDAYSDFISAVRSEINLFETDTNVIVTTFKEAINSRLTEFNENYSIAFAEYQKDQAEIFSNFESDLREEYSAYKNDLELIIQAHIERFANQDAKIDDAVAYMKTNLNTSLELLLRSMNDSGELIGVIDTDVFVTPQLYGAVGDGAHDDWDAIMSAIGTGKPVKFPKGVYRTTMPIYISAGNHINFDASACTIKYEGDDSAIKIEGLTDSNIILGSVHSPNGDGISFYGVASENYTQYINVDFQTITAGRYGVHCHVDGGWCNEVHFFKGRISAPTAVFIETASADECTGWKFNEISVEGSALGFHFKAVNSRFGSIEINSPRYGDDNSAKVLKIEGTMRMMNFRSAQPFYPHYISEENATIYNSVMECPFTDAEGNVKYFKRVYNSAGKYIECGDITREQQERFMDFSTGSIGTSSGVSVSCARCRSNSFHTLISCHVTINDAIGAWSKILTIPTGCRPASNGACKVFIPNRNLWTTIYVNADGSVTTETNLTSGDEFDLNYIDIKNGDFNL